VHRVKTINECNGFKVLEYWFSCLENVFRRGSIQWFVKRFYTGTPEYDVNKRCLLFEQVLAKKSAGIFVHRPMNPECPSLSRLKPCRQNGHTSVTFAADSSNTVIAFLSSLWCGVGGGGGLGWGVFVFPGGGLGGGLIISRRQVCRG